MDRWKTWSTGQSTRCISTCRVHNSKEWKAKGCRSHAGVKSQAAWLDAHNPVVWQEETGEAWEQGVKKISCKDIFQKTSQLTHTHLPCLDWRQQSIVRHVVFCHPWPPPNLAREEWQKPRTGVRATIPGLCHASVWLRDAGPFPSPPPLGVSLTHV